MVGKNVHAGVTIAARAGHECALEHAVGDKRQSPNSVATYTREAGPCLQAMAGKKKSCKSTPRETRMNHTYRTPAQKLA